MQRARPARSGVGVPPARRPLPCIRCREGSAPGNHRDPFDRFLVAQAQVEEMAILTADRALRPYAVEII